MKKANKNAGFSIVELAISMLVSLIVVLAVAVSFIDAAQGWQYMSGRVNGPIFSESYVAQKTFDREIRKACMNKPPATDGSTYIEVYYNPDANSIVMNRYCKFSYNSTNKQLRFETGNLSGTTHTADNGYPTTLCSNIVSCAFKISGRSVQMMLQSNLNNQAETTVTSAYLNNFY